MKEMTLEEVVALDDAMPVPMLAGHVRTVFERKSGVGEFGEWSFQDGILTDGNTDIRLKFKNMEDMKAIQGKEVTIRANKSPKHGLTGVVKVIEEYKGKTLHKVQLTNSCKIVVGLNGGDDNENTARLDAMRAKGERFQEPIEPDLIPMDHDSKGNALAGVTEAKQHLMRCVNFYNLCVNAVDSVVKPNVENMTAEMYQAAVSSVFIEGSRSGMIAKMPVTKL